MFEIGRFRHILTLAPTTTSLLNGHDVLISLEEHIQNAHKLPTIHQVSQGRTLRLKKTREKAYTGIVLIHLVLLETNRHIFFQEFHHVQEYLTV